LVDVYKVIYQDNEEVDYDIPLVTRRYRSVEFNDQCWGSESSRLSRSSYVLAAWCGISEDVPAERTCTLGTSIEPLVLEGGRRGGSPYH